MFVGFFYLLRQRGFGVSLNEWMTLMEGLLLGLHRSTLTGFYDLCRAVLVKSEADYDKFDAAFLEYFKDVPFPEELLPDELMDWLNHPKNALEEFRAFLREQGYVLFAESNRLVLTEKGRAKAEAVYERHRVISRFLMLTLDVDEALAAKDACRFEHDISDETFACLKAHIAGRNGA